MTGKERFVEIFGVWLAVYPAVMAMSYVFEWLNLGWPLWLELAVSTAMTVPLISLVAVPKVRLGLAKAEGTTPAGLARREAREAERKEGAAAPGE
jgi:hypothetical protein